MRFRIEPVDNEDPATAASLYRWLRDDPDSRRDLDVALDSEPRPGQMGAFDVITALVTESTGIGSLAVAFAAWRDSRRRPPTVKVSLGADAVVLSADSVEQLTAALTELAEKHAADRDPDA